MLSDRIREEMMTAMKAGDALSKGILRVALGEVQVVASREGRDLADDEVVAILRKLLKSNRETLAMTTDAEKQSVLERENAILSELLPQTLSAEAVATALEPVLEQIRGAKSDGQATGVAMKHLKASGAAVSGQMVAAAVKALRAEA